MNHLDLGPGPHGLPEQRAVALRNRMILGAAALAVWLTCGVGSPIGGSLHASVGGLGAPPVALGEMYGPCHASNVVDGDTVDVHCGSEWDRVRLLNVDTPERGELGYREAAEALAGWLEGEVYLVFEEPNVPRRGRYGRLLAYLYDDQGRNLNELLVREGWSPFYREYGNGRFPTAFEAAEEEAADEGSGLWEAY